MNNFEDRLLRQAIGYDPFRRFTLDANKYPPHNIEQVSEIKYLLTMAVAGFKENDITIELKNDLLTVTGRYNHSDDKNLLYSGIAFRDFHREFKLGENMEVTNAKLSDGLLIISFEREIPEEQKPKLIEIKTK